jgi:xylan 1,4-beta-xylosidase
MVQMNMGSQLNDIKKGFEIVASYPEFKDLPIIIGESDPEGCAACSEADYPHNAYRNGTMYSSYTAASFARKYALADEYGVNLLGVVTWGFEFEDQAWFAGFRDMATNGVNKPVLNVFRMFGMMSGNRVEVVGNLAYDHQSIIESGVREEQTDINALASKDDHSACIMVWNYHDNNIDMGKITPVLLNLKGLTAGKVLLEHFTIDQKNSNSYNLWLKMGSPQSPTNEQIALLEDAGQLKLATSPAWITVKDEQIALEIDLERQAVSLLRLTW